jgi:phospho-N-acetylmuramoyl-pentapeptide-transferase
MLNVVKIFFPWLISFFAGLAFSPFLTHYLYKYKMWKKHSGKGVSLGGGGTPLFDELHKERDTNTPRMGGVVIWVSVLFTIFVFWFISQFFPSEFAKKIDFMSRGQTWLPLFTLIGGALVGLFDDFLVVSGKGKYIAGGLSLTIRILIVLWIGLIGATWFFFKLDMSSIFVPFWGEWELGLLFIPFFMLTMLFLFSSGVIDGIDGLSGGVLATIFTAYACIAFFQNQIDLAAFCAVVVGGILAFLWFNIPPARFYMTETGILGLTTSLTVVAFLTNQVLVLPIIAFPLFATVASNLIQVASKKFRNGKKVFLIAPLHHHFEALGWPSYKVTMRYWIISIIFAILGMVVALMS